MEGFRVPKLRVSGTGALTFRLVLCPSYVPMRNRSRKPKKSELHETHIRLFSDDVEALQRIAAEKGIPWQIELRLLVRRALKGEIKEVFVLKDAP